MSKKHRTIRAKHDRVKKEILFASAGVSMDNSGKLPTCHIVAYTGGAFEWDWKEYPLVVDLETATFAASSIPLLYDHWDNFRVGHTTAQAIVGGQIVLDGVISGVSEEAARIVAESRNGFPWQASIGARYGRVDFFPEGNSVTVNGKTFEGPIEVAHDVEVYETSFVVFGADKKTSGVIAKKSLPRTLRGEKNNKERIVMDFSTWSANLGYNEDDMNDDVKAALQTAFASIQANDNTDEADDVNASDDNEDNSDDPKDDEDKLDASNCFSQRTRRNMNREQLRAYRMDMAAENKRIAKIHSLCGGHFDALEAKAIEDGWDPVYVENRVLKAKAKQDRKNPPVTHNGSNGQDIGRVLEASALIATGAKPKWLQAQGYDPKVLDMAETRPWRGCGLQRLIAVAMESAGKPVPGGLTGSSFYSAACDSARNIRAAGGLNSFSTVSLGGILSNIANKSLLDAYMSRESTLMKIASTSNHPDFKGMYEYRLDASGQMKRVGDGGKIESISLSEEPYYNEIDTQAALISLTRKMIINDDLNAFTSIPRQLGQLAFDTREMEGWQIIMSNLATFFTTGRRNKIDDPLSISGIAHAEQHFAEQVNANKMPISVNAKYIIVPPYLYPLARVLYTSMFVNETTAEGIAKPVNNPVTNLYEPIMVPHFGELYKNGSNKHWMVIADPAQVPVVNVAFLNGTDAPVIEESDSSFDTLGYQYRVYIDFGIAMYDYRGGVYSDGTGDIAAMPPIPTP